MRNHEERFFIAPEFAAPPDRALFHVIPAPLEKSVSYGTGAALGPAAILEASKNVEVFDGAGEPWKAGIFTAAGADCSGSMETALQNIAAATETALGAGAVPVLLGGEHTLTVGSFSAVKRRFPDAAVVQFDAHSDLRGSFRGLSMSHACVMRKIYDTHTRIFQIGVRSMSPEEHVFRSQNKIPFLDAEEINTRGVPSDFPDAWSLPEKIYLTFDVDGLDPSVVPATGTPEPGGLSWWTTLDMIRRIAEKTEIIAMDFVELAPSEGLHCADFAVARLVYNVMGIVQRAGDAKKQN
jgi:agmatinase